MKMLREINMKKKVLIAEDEKGFMEHLEMVFEKEMRFIKVEFAANGWDLIQRLVENPGDYMMVISDIDMYPIGGDDLENIINILNKNGVTDVEMLFISGKIKKRPGHFIEKPFEMQDFSSKVCEILDKAGKLV